MNLRRRSRIATQAALLSLLALGGADAQQGVVLGAGEVGIGLGNVPRLTGVRINLVDRDVEQVDGVNLTLWRPRDNPDFQIDGIALGLVVGIHGAGLAVVSEGDMTGIHGAGLAVVSQRDLRGLNAAALATVSRGDHQGLNLAGLAAVAEGDFSGLTVAGLAAVAEGGQSGMTLAGLAAVTEGTARWLTVGGLSVVAGRLEGAGVSLGKVVTPDQAGLALSGWNDVRGVNRGISIAIYNYARSSPGLQIGLLNYVRNNRDGLRLLPLFNRDFP